jgi:hypothetical protein
MYQDFKDLLSAFHAHGVKYLIVGGYAVIFHAQPRSTKDIDLLIKADPENARATYAALKELECRSATSALKISPRAGIFFVSGMSLAAWTFCPTFLASVSSRRGNAGCKESSIRQLGLARSLSQPRISLRQSLPLEGRKTSRMPKRFVKRSRRSHEIR